MHGKGTRFTIKLPLTLAIIQGLLVRVGKEVYSIPITSVIESHRIKPSDVKMIDNYEVFNIRNDGRRPLEAQPPLQDSDERAARLPFRRHRGHRGQARGGSWSTLS